MALSLDFANVPWSLLMAFASLALIYYLFRRRADVFADFGFSGKEVALLALGSIAGGAVNIPLAVFGGTYLTVNVGGTVVPIILIAWWIRKRKLRLLPAVVGTALVAFTAWRIVEFRPDIGIIARYPHFFLPVVVALVFALLVSVRRPITGVPIAYASGTMGALIGADVMNIGAIRRHFATAHDNTVISIGGAGVFDMVFLAGTFAMALHIALVVLIHRPRAASADRQYPGTPLSLRDSRRVDATFRKLESPNALERAIQGIALSNLALREGEFTRSVRMSWLAVESVLSHTGPPAAEPAQQDVQRLHEQYLAVRTREATLSEAGDANLAAKHLVAALAHQAKLRHSLEGIA
ncbi:MAG TPA: DUF1614 domain-containing protein [Candidatus Thermoplasmatota archaeon]|nr:DUF1614 domain-containing protein [Candidatus Thermoplasmatota archaeon]